MHLRLANCGHWISADVQRVGYDHERPQYEVYLCAECKEKALASQEPKEPALTKKA